MNTRQLPNSQTISKPRKTIVPLAIGLSWGESDEYVYQEKLDGRFETRLVRGISEDLRDTLLAGEYVRGEFYAFDLLRLQGEDCRHWQLHERLAGLDGVFGCEPIDCTGGIIRRVQSAVDGGKFLAEVLARGGEGIVRKYLASRWGDVMDACKRLETFRCVVTGLNAGQSVQISRIINSGELRESDPSGFEEEHFYHSIEMLSCGSVKLGGGKCDRIRVGSIIKVEGFGLTRAGQIREPRPCKDTPNSWLGQY